MSGFSSTGRDSFVRPYQNQALDPALVTAGQQAVTAVETLCQSAIVVDRKTARSNSLCFAVQRWMFTYNGTQPYGGSTVLPKILLSLSPAVLEDAGLLTPQDTNPLVSLASNNALEARKSSLDLPGMNGLSLSSPGWAERLVRCPVVSFNVRLVGAVDDQMIALVNTRFFDAGSGVSPKATGILAYASPDYSGLNLPIGTYEISLTVGNWAS